MSWRTKASVGVEVSDPTSAACAEDVGQLGRSLQSRCNGPVPTLATNTRAIVIHPTICLRSRNVVPLPSSRASDNSLLERCGEGGVQGPFHWCEFVRGAVGQAVSTTRR